MILRLVIVSLLVGWMDVPGGGGGCGGGDPKYDRCPPNCPADAGEAGKDSSGD